MNALFHDLRYALRQLSKSPGFAITAVLTLALGIGANAAIFTLLDSILLRPLPFPEQDRLMRVSYSAAESDTSFFPKGWIRALGEHSASFAAIGGFGADAESNVVEGGAPERVFGAEITANAFETLGIHPAQGRFFTPDDAVAGHDPVVVLSYGYWQGRFAGSPNVIGQSIRIDGVWRQIVGVMPAGVHFPYADTQFVAPVVFRSADPVDPWSNFNLRAFGRLKDGVTPGQAQAELRRLSPSLLTLFPWRMPDIWANQMTAVPLLESETGAMRPKLMLLFGAVGLILLIACSNVANLMLARATVREREMAIRTALGASGGRIFSQLLSESVVVGLAAGAVGLLAAFASLRGFVHLLPPDTPRIGNVSLRWPDILFTFGASLLAGLLFGLIPSLKMASPNRIEMIHIGGRGLVGKTSRFGPSAVLVMVQIGLSVVVIAAAGLVLHSLYQLSMVDPGFLTSGTVTAEVSLDSATCGEKGRCHAFFDTLLDRAPGIAGVDSVALADTLPLSGRTGNYVYDAENHPRDARQGALVATGRTVSPDYFKVLGLRLVRGRLLDREDGSGASRAVVINERMANLLWPNENPLGKHLIDVGDEPSPAVWNPVKASLVVGVVHNTHEEALETSLGNEVYLPVTPAREAPVMYILLRSHTAPAETATALRRVVAGIDSQVPVTRVRSLDEVVATSQTAPRVLAVLLLGFGALAVIIGGVGVYSLIAYIVSWRTREIGLRLALGAQRWQIVLAVLRQSLFLAGCGCAAGLAGAAALSRLLQSFLFEVNAIDPITFCSVPLLMLAAALLAAWLPARRAASVDPMQALRTE
ncbi:MAG: ABC transporter permease [Terracidiphilus sp.]|jgi:predicted permease